MVDLLIGVKVKSSVEDSLRTVADAIGEAQPALLSGTLTPARSRAAR
jgi:hypothetical protein